MCGRYRLSKRKQLVEEHFDIPPDESGRSDDWIPRSNIAPTQPVMTIRVEGGKRKAREMRWGLIPSWASGITSANFNARSESVTTTPSFKDLIGTNRCLIPADAFYEWQKQGNVKQPFAFEVGKKELFALAGLWDEWKDPDDKLIRSCTILTTDANALVAELHDRMPVLVPKGMYEVWLNPKSPLSDVLGILKPFDPTAMQKYPVSTALNNAQNEGAEIAERIELETPAQGSLF